MIKVNGLTKLYNNKKGISSLNFEVDDGEIAAFVGPNGAGKTTLFKTIAGILDKDSGVCTLNGNDFSKANIKKKIGWIDEIPFVFQEMTPIQFALYVREMKEITISDSEINELICFIGLSEHKNQKIKTFSQGMYKKVAIVPAFMGKPELLILDEPTNGLDTYTLIKLKQLLLKAKEQKTSILISSHVLDFIGNIADVVYFLKEGSICLKKYGYEVDLEKMYMSLYIDSKK